MTLTMQGFQAASEADSLKAEGRLDEAAEAYRRAFELSPTSADVACNYGAALAAVRRWDEACTAYRESLRLKPNVAGVHHNLGSALKALGRFDEALAQLGRAVELEPDYAAAQTLRALIYLLRGDLGRGFYEYEWRWKKKNAALPDYPAPRWEGSSLEGRTLLLQPEQGTGDMLHFVRYAPLLRRFGGRVVLGCSEPLRRLLASLPGVDEFATAGVAAPHFDVYAPLASLPNILGTTLETIPADVPYLFADPSLAERWKSSITDGSQSDKPVKVGIAWQGSLKHPRDNERSVPLELFRPLVEVPGVRLFSLQKGPGSEQLAAADWAGNVIELGSRCEDYADTAAAIENLDLVITVDTSVAHLAGAMGKPTWVVLPLVPDWRWMLARDDSPWYPTMQLFRQREDGNWGKVFERVHSALSERTSKAASPTRGRKSSPRRPGTQA
jgi:hypothetical protein